MRPTFPAAGAPILASALLVLAGCSAAARPGTGDVAFRLEWTGDSDLDLWVEDPSGEALHFNHRASESGGVLDIDCNAVESCRRPVENVFWPTGQAPPGRYRFRVTLFRTEPDEPHVDFKLTVFLGEVPTRTIEGTLVELQESTEVYDYVFTPRRPGG